MAPSLTVAEIPTVKVARGAAPTITVKAHLASGYHANSNKPSDDYLIPLTLKWEAGPLTAEKVVYPAGSMEKYPFSEKPLSVVTGDFAIATTFKVTPGAATGPAALKGSLRYQACDTQRCYAPKTVPVKVTVSVE
jgi:hypothetical protein